MNEIRMQLNLQDQYRMLGENVAKIRTDMMKEQLATFRSQLEEFARKHKVPTFDIPPKLASCSLNISKIKVFV
jgi:hypothetical protein